MDKHHHFMLHKPYGYLSQFVHQHRQRKNKKMLGPLYDWPEGTMAIGRLDQDSEGLLLLTTDGKVSEQVRARHVEKEYYAQVDGEITPDVLEAMALGVQIRVNGSLYNTNPCKVAALASTPNVGARGKKIRDERHGPTSWVSIMLTEGKNRQVRKMTAAVGYPTLRLVRVRIGNLRLNGLIAGEVLPINSLSL